ncbi:MAG: FAD:protein FMN transferase [Planctomycetaceae bacterium]|nr:FAD:protein FMN transferase [Planctomycetaceae bacterium]
MSRHHDELLIHVSRRAMASEFEVCFPADEYEDGTRLALQSLDAVDAVEEELSFFRPESVVSRINRLAAAGPVAVEPQMFALLKQASDLCAETGGAYDITSAPLWQAWGFARRAGQIPSAAELAQAQSCVGGHRLELDPGRQTVRFRQPGMKISLGSIGKGYALDVCSERLLESGMTNFLIHGGQSSVLAHGVNRRSDWAIGVCHPHHIGERLATVRLRNRALGTSSSQFQSFRHEGRRYGHILDPRTGQPAEGVLSVTVTAPTAAMADALSTAFYVLGPERSLEYCRRYPDVSMFMVCPARVGEKVEIVTVGFRADELVMVTR